jgi:hypothetical protein
MRLLLKSAYLGSVAANISNFLILTKNYIYFFKKNGPWGACGAIFCQLPVKDQSTTAILPVWVLSLKSIW